jgi:hypothetical protein
MNDGKKPINTVILKFYTPAPEPFKFFFLQDPSQRHLHPPKLLLPPECSFVLWALYALIISLSFTNNVQLKAELRILHYAELFELFSRPALKLKYFPQHFVLKHPQHTLFFLWQEKFLANRETFQNIMQEEVKGLWIIDKLQDLH